MVYEGSKDFVSSAHFLILLETVIFHAETLQVK